MTPISYDASGSPMTPSGYPDGHSVPIAQPGASDLARMRRDRELDQWRDQEAHRREIRQREDAARDQRLAVANREREDARRVVAEAVAAAKRRDVERDLRLDGVPEHQVKALADQTMADYFRSRAREAAEKGDRATRELTDYFHNQPAPSFDG